jgi:hypothetical protein
MSIEEKPKYICSKLLEIYNVAKNVESHDLKHFTTHISQLYGFAHIFSFDYKDHHYYVSDDYSLDDKLEYVKNVFLEIDTKLQGALLKNPVAQSDGARYAAGLNGVEYYLWQAT